MSPRRTRRAQTRRTENGTRTLSLGHEDYRVRLFENREKGGMIYREVQLPNGRKSRRSLGTRDWARAEELGLQIVAGLISGHEAPMPAGPVRLGELASDSSPRVRCYSTTQIGLRRRPRRASALSERSSAMRATYARCRRTTCDSTRHGAVPAASIRKGLRNRKSETARGASRHQAAQAGAVLGMLGHARRLAVGYSNATRLSTCR